VTTAIWIVASIALVAVIVYTVVRVVRGLIRLFLDFSDLAGVTARLDSVQATRDLARPEVAVARPWRAVKNDFDDRMHDRRLRKDARLDARLARARSLVSADLRDLPAFPAPRG
jgi:hypothetical protein